jgi:hypothetical protein
LERYGDAAAYALKLRVMELIRSGRATAALTVPDTRFARQTVKVALRQMQAPPEWREAYDPGAAETERYGHLALAV